MQARRERQKDAREEQGERKPKKVVGKRSAAPLRRRAVEPRRKRAKSAGEGVREEARGERTARLWAPRSATWEVPAPRQAGPNVPPGGSPLGRGHNYTSAPGEDLKTKWRGLQSGSKALRSSEGGRASAQKLFTRRVGTWGKKNQNKPLSSSVGRENKSCLIKGASGSFEI